MLLSVIIPVFNGEQTLRRCLDSVLAQITEEMQVLVVNDGSTDKTANMLDEYARAHATIKVFTQQNRGQAAARNLALEHASGKWVCFVDADDYWGEGYIAQLLEELSDHIDVLQTGFTQLRPVRSKRKYRFLSAWSKVVRLDFLKKHHILFPEGLYYDDPVWAARLWQAKPRIALSNNTKYQYTINKQSITANPKPTAPVRKELRNMGLRPWSFGWLRTRLTFHFIKNHHL